eukprot:scaffold20.g7607.t1
MLRDYVTKQTGAQNQAESTVRLQVTHSNLQATFMELRLDRHMTVGAVKSKLCFHCGTPPSAMRLQLKDAGGAPQAALDDEARKLGFYSPADGWVLHVVDTDPTSLSANGWLEDTSKARAATTAAAHAQVEKYVMSDEAYDAREGTYRRYRAARLAEDPTWSLEKELAARRGEAYEAPKCRPRAEDDAHQAAEAAAVEVGVRCEVEGGRRGAVRYVGHCEGLPKGWWVGVQYDEPVGKNDGSIKGQRYFECPPGYGGFVRPALVKTGPQFTPFDADLFGSEDELMAKFDEGDPRWLVQDLGEAGRNVNAWHWTEKDAMPWCKEKLGQLLGGLALVEGPGSEARVTKVEAVDGEAAVHNRKGKVITLYELDVRLGWEGTADDGAAAAGELRLPYVSEENHDEDPEVQVTATSGGAGAERLRQLVYEQGRRAVLARVHEFVAELRAGGPMRAGGADGANGAPAATPAAAAAEANPAAPAAPPAAAAPAAAAAGKPDAVAAAGARNIQLSTRFFASAGDLYDCFTDARRMMAYTRAPAEAEAAPGGRLSLFGGSIEAAYRELEPGARLVLDWRAKDWEPGVFSRVTISIREKERGNTSVSVEQRGIPEADRFGHHDCAGTAREGWERLLRQIKQTFGYGVPINAQGAVMMMIMPEDAI